MSYRQFVKENFHSLGNIPAKEKMKKLGEMWRKHTGKVKITKQAKGKGLIGDMFPPAQLIGLGMKKRGRKPKVDKGGEVAGGGILSGILGSVGLGMHKKRGRKPKVAKGGEVAGGGILSSVLDSVGLGVSDKVKQKHFKRMTALEQKLHKMGKLTPALHHKLKIYHHLHGAGFFDSLFSNLKKGASAVVNNFDTIKKVVPEIAKMAPDGMKAKMIGALPMLSKVL